MGQRIVQTTKYFNDTLTGAINPTLAAPLLLSAAKQGLSKAAFTPAVGTTFADTPAPTWTGYAQSATIVWGAALNEADGSQTSLSPAALFRATAVPTPESVYGGIVTDGVAAPGTGILGSWKLDTPIPFANPGDGFSVVIAWNYGPNPAYSQATVIQ